MKAVILAGGKGTRLSEETHLLPKPMLEIGGKPILWHIMKIYARHGIKDFIVCLGYKGWVIKDFFLNYQAKISDFSLTLSDKSSLRFSDHTDENNWNVTLAETGEDSQTGARVWNIRKYLKGEKHFCLTYGDGVADIDISGLLEAHKKSGLIGTISSVRPSGRFGEIEIDNNIITEFNEKPNVGAGYINGGFMIFDAARVWDYFKPEGNLILETEVLPRIAKDKQLGAFKHDGFWQCVDTYREYVILNKLWEENNALWKTWK